MLSMVVTHIRDQEQSVYPSKVDLWLGILLGAMALCVPTYMAAAVWIWKAAPNEAIIFIISAVFIALLLAFLVWPVRYILETRELVIRFGVIRVRIPYKDIQEISASRSLWSAPALSLDRLMIRYRGGMALISPVRKERFLQDLAGRDSGLVLTANRIVRP